MLCYGLCHLSLVVLPVLLPLVTSPDVCLRHGALVAVSEVCHALYELAVAGGQFFNRYIGADISKALCQVVPRVSYSFKGAQF